MTNRARGECERTRDLLHAGSVSNVALQLYLVLLKGWELCEQGRVQKGALEEDVSTGRGLGEGYGDLVKLERHAQQSSARARVSA